MSYLILNDNRLNGTIPTSIAQWNLWDMLLYDNLLSGSIPSEIGSIAGLAFIQLWNNDLSGTIPTSVGNILNLTSLDVSNNRHIRGVIPSELCSLKASVNVENTEIDCYSGCLTSSSVVVQGASSYCSSDYELRRFIIIVSFVGIIGVVATVWYFQYNYLYKIPIYQWSNTVPWMSFIKLIVVILVVFLIDNYWSYCDGSSGGEVIKSCTSSDFNTCTSYCDDVSQEIFEITDDIGMQHNSIVGYCTAIFDGDCACSYWKTYMLFPLLLHFLQFFGQMVCLICCVKFDPQQLHYNIIYNHITSTSMKLGSTAVWKAMMEELFRQPYYCVFSFLELATIIYVWLELIYAPVRCNQGIQLSELYFPIVMTLVDFGKFNVYLAVQHYRQKQYYAALTSLFNIHMLVVYIIVSSVLGILYSITILRWMWNEIAFILVYCIHGCSNKPTIYEPLLGEDIKDGASSMHTNDAWNGGASNERLDSHVLGIVATTLPDRQTVTSSASGDTIVNVDTRDSFFAGVDDDTSSIATSTI